jgi:hypothetical protein
MNGQTYAGDNNMDSDIVTKGSRFGNWLWWKLMIKKLFVIFIFWLTIFLAVYLISDFFKNNEVDQMKNKINTLNIEIEKMQSKAETMKTDVILESILKLQPKLDEDIAEKISNAILENCMKKDLSPYLVVCLIFVESGYNQMAASNKGAIGLMQVHWDSWNGSEICKDVTTKADLYQIDINIDCGTSILKQMIEEGGSVKKGLNSYYGVESQTYHGKMANALYKIMF